METDIRPIDDNDYSPMVHNQHESETVQNQVDNEEDSTQLPPQMFFPPHEMFQHHHQPSPNNQKKDLFGEIDKTTYIIIFVAFILGFFMGKTMQPVILRPG